MKQRIKLYLVSLLAVFGMGLAVVPQAAFADSAVGTACDALGSGDCQDTSGGADINKIIKTAITIFTWVVGVAAVLMIVVSGFMFVTSGGDAGKVKTARTTLVYALVGIVVVALAQAIVAFTISKATS